MMWLIRYMCYFVLDAMKNTWIKSTVHFLGSDLVFYYNINLFIDLWVYGPVKQKPSCVCVCAVLQQRMSLYKKLLVTSLKASVGHSRLSHTAAFGGQMLSV